MADAIKTAHNLIRGERARHYGPPHDNFATISQLWSVYLAPKAREAADLGEEFTLDEIDVCNLMTLLKIAREATGNGYHEDSTVDAIGYQGIKQILHDMSKEEFVREIRTNPVTPAPAAVSPSS